MRLAWALVLASGLVGSVPLIGSLGGLDRHVAAAAGAAASPLLGRPTDLRADEVTVDNTGKTLVATGHVMVTYGTLRATGDRLRLSRPAGTAVFTGHVVVTDPRGRASGDGVTLYVAGEAQVSRVVMAGNASIDTPDYSLSADRIVADRQADRLAARGRVFLFAAPDLFVTGASAAYDRRADYAVVTGDAATPCVLQSKDGRVRGSWMELFRAAQRAVVHGPLEAEAYGAVLTGAEAAVDLRGAVVIVTGHVTLIRRQETLVADRVTILYRDRRLIADGTTHLTLTDSGESPPSP